MDTMTLLLAIMAVCMIGVTLHAWRIGNEKRDVALLGVVAVLFSAGTGVAVLS
jgi:hypothetical protein